MADALKKEKLTELAKNRRRKDIEARKKEKCERISLILFGHKTWL